MQECNFETQAWEGGSSSLLDLGVGFFSPCFHSGSIQVGSLIQ